MAQHTPGPWTIRPSLDGSGDVGITAAELPNVLAECFLAIRSGKERAYDEAKANARLIAAAPDMLEALKAARLQLRLLGGEPGDDPHGDGIQAAILKHVDAAVAKAEGRS